MPIVDRVKWDGPPSIIAWKFPSEELSTWTQLIVNESQEAYLVRGGVYEGPFGAGRHTLSTENIPILRSAMGLPFGGKTPFSAEVWFVNRVTKLDVKWGTAGPIQIQDPQFQVMIPLRANGQYGIRIADTRRFLRMFVGANSLGIFDVDTVSAYLRGKFTERITTEIAKTVVENNIPVLQIATKLNIISYALAKALETDLTEYGITLQQFSIASINFPEDDPAVKTLRAALAKRAEMGIVGFNYQQERSFDVLQAAASNEGSAQSGVMGAGLGLGLGVGMGVPMGQVTAGMSQSIFDLGRTEKTTVQDGALSIDKKLEALSKLAELRAAGVLTEAEFEREKSKLLGA
jgi:membrane protease subunit (stomatin/prohibitin family)